MHNIRKTSLEAFDHLQYATDKIGKNQKRILLQLKVNGPMTNLEISRKIQLPINSVTPRIKELRQLDLVHEVGSKVDSITKRRAIVWGIKQKDQLEFA